MKPTYTAICFFPENQKKRPHKYKNCSTPARLCIYMKRKGAEYINFYCSNTQEYKFRLYCESGYNQKQNTGEYMALMDNINDRLRKLKERQKTG
jgi:predicted transcriptional regulator